VSTAKENKNKEDRPRDPDQNGRLDFYFLLLCTLIQHNKTRERQLLKNEGPTRELAILTSSKSFESKSTKPRALSSDSGQSLYWRCCCCSTSSSVSGAGKLSVSQPESDDDDASLRSNKIYSPMQWNTKKKVKLSVFKLGLK